MVDLRPRWTMGYPGYGRRSDTMVDPRPRWAMGQWPIESLPTLKSFVPRSVPYYITHDFQVSAAAAATLHARPAKVGETLPFLSFCDKICRFSKSDAFYQRSLLQESPGASIIVDPGNQSVSLTCPISLQRQVVPVRTLLCKHVETFDLENFISAIPSKFSY